MVGEPAMLLKTCPVTAAVLHEGCNYVLLPVDKWWPLLWTADARYGNHHYLDPKKYTNQWPGATLRGSGPVCYVFWGSRHRYCLKEFFEASSRVKTCLHHAPGGAKVAVKFPRKTFSTADGTRAWQLDAE